MFRQHGDERLITTWKAFLFPCSLSLKICLQSNALPGIEVTAQSVHKGWWTMLSALVCFQSKDIGKQWVTWHNTLLHLHIPFRGLIGRRNSSKQHWGSLIGSRKKRNRPVGCHLEWSFTRRFQTFPNVQDWDLLFILVLPYKKCAYIAYKGLYSTFKCSTHYDTSLSCLPVKG